MFFLPEAQHDVPPNAGATEISPSSHFMGDIVIVTRPGANLSIAQVRQAMASVDPDLPLTSIRPLKEQIARQFRQQRLIARLTSFFGVLSLVLASIGLYGVTAYNAGRRVSEIGVRADISRLDASWRVKYLLPSSHIGLSLLRRANFCVAPNLLWVRGLHSEFDKYEVCHIDRHQLMKAEKKLRIHAAERSNRLCHLEFA